MNNLDDIHEYIKGLCSGIYGSNVFKNRIPEKKNNENITSGCAIRTIGAATETTTTGHTTNWVHNYSILTRDPTNESIAESVVNLLNGTNEQIVGDTRILDIQAVKPNYAFTSDSTKLEHFNIDLVVHYA